MSLEVTDTNKVSILMTKLHIIIFNQIVSYCIIIIYELFGFFQNDEVLL